MNLSDFSQRFKAQRGMQTREQTRSDAPAPLDVPTDPAEAARIRARMIGLLLHDARIYAGRSLEDCAACLHLPDAEIEAWEMGDSAPTLPQLEMLAIYLDVPIRHFWGTTTLAASQPNRGRAQAEYLALRDRMIGALVRQAREKAGLSLAALAQAAELEPVLLEAYEFGEVAIPMHDLTVLANAVRVNLDYFLESSSQIGELLALKAMWAHFTELPDEVREFAANPLNIGFIEIAIMFSKLPVDSLRRVGENMLNIAL
jgi:transcriptional regulator with XRE-family HTH domain